jgi:hypothetical protein
MKFLTKAFGLAALVSATSVMDRNAEAQMIVPPAQVIVEEVPIASVHVGGGHGIQIRLGGLNIGAKAGNRPPSYDVYGRPIGAHVEVNATREIPLYSTIPVQRDCAQCHHPETFQTYVPIQPPTCAPTRRYTPSAPAPFQPTPAQQRINSEWRPANPNRYPLNSFPEEPPIPTPAPGYEDGRPAYP